MPSRAEAGIQAAPDREAEQRKGSRKKGVLCERMAGSASWPSPSLGSSLGALFRILGEDVFLQQLIAE